MKMLLFVLILLSGLPAFAASERGGASSFLLVFCNMTLGGFVAAMIKRRMMRKEEKARQEYEKLVAERKKSLEEFSLSTERDTKEGGPVDNEVEMVAVSEEEIKESDLANDTGSFFSTYCRGWANILNYSGSAGRSEYWKFVAVHVLVSIVLAIIGLRLGTMVPLNCYGLAAFLPLVPLGLRRFRDAGLSVADWMALTFLTAAGAFATGYFGMMNHRASPMIARALSLTLFLSSTIITFFVLCLSSYKNRGWSAVANARQRKVYAWYFALFIVFAVALIAVPAVLDYLRIGDDKRLVEENVRKANEARKKSGHSRRGVQDERRKSDGRLREEFVDVFPDVRVSVPKGYRIVKPGSVEDSVIAALDKEPTPDGETKARLIRSDEGDDANVFDGMLKISINRKFSGSKMSVSSFEKLTNSLAMEMRKLAREKERLKSEFEKLRGAGHIARSAEMPEFEVVSVHNTPTGMFTSTVIREHEDGSKEDHWILVSQGLVRVNGRVIILTHFKICESRSSAVADASRQWGFIENWGKVIAVDNNK